MFNRNIISIIIFVLTVIVICFFYSTIGATELNYDLVENKNEYIENQEIDINLDEIVWNSGEKDILHEISKAEILFFYLRKIHNNLYSFTFISEFIFEDIDKDGYFELVFNGSPSEYKEYYEIIIIRQNKNYPKDKEKKVKENLIKKNKELENCNIIFNDIQKYTIERISNINKKPIKDIVVDLDDDGLKDILGDTTISTFPFIRWVSVYKYKSNKYEVSDKEFPDFYINDFLPTVQKELDELMNKKYYTNKSEVKDYMNFRTYHKKQNIKGERELTLIEKDHLLIEKYIQIFKIKRIAGIEKKAGLDKAVLWAKTKDPVLKLASIIILKDIKDTKSIKILTELSYDENDRVSKQAKDTLIIIKKDLQDSNQNMEE